MAERVVVVDPEHGVASAVRWCRYDREHRRRDQREQREERAPQ
jgi:hypothetical protein